MDDKSKESTLTSQLKIEGFPLAYDKDLNIYVVLENSYANRLIELHLVNKLATDQYKGYSWYLHPQEALYMISVMDGVIESQKNAQKIRRQSMQDIYKTTHAKDINTLHFYLNMRKKNKFIRRLDRFQLQSIEGVKEWYKKADEFRVFKLYQLSEDYKLDISFKYVMVLDPQDRIVQTLYNEFVQRLRKVLNIHVLHICIFSNNDYVFLEIRN